MTKSELLKFLEPFTDDIEIFVNTGLGISNLTKVKPIQFALYFYRNVTGYGEVWLNLQAPVQEKK